jgi:FixJ family two-component response regulator
MKTDKVDVTPKQTVFIVEDDLSVSEALCDLIESAGLPTSNYSSATTFLNAWNLDMAGCLVLDVRLPGMSGMELQARLAELKSTLPVIIMTAHGDIPMVRKALKAGAVEFLTKPFQDKELLAAIEHAFAIDRAERSKRDLARSIASRLATLSARERQVMELVTSGLTNIQVAAMLNLSVITVKIHRGQAMEKMQAGSFAELVKMAEKLNAS